MVRIPGRSRFPQLLERFDHFWRVIHNVRQVIRLHSFPEQRAAEEHCPIGQRHNGILRSGVVQQPVLHMLFRPEEIHAASGHAPGNFLFQCLRERDIDMPDNGRRVYFYNLIIPHMYADRFSAIQATGLNNDILSRK